MIRQAAPRAQDMTCRRTKYKSTGIEGAFAEMRRQAQDTATMIKNVFTETINGINEQLVNLMSGKKTDFKGVMSGMFRQVAKGGLQVAEGKLAGAFHLGGKRDGSSPATALYVTSAGAGKGATSAGSIWKSILGALIPHATGGTVMPGSAYLVGERGPEPFFPGVSGTMGTNAAMQRAFGGTTNHLPVYVDARGATDPAAINMAVHRAMRSYGPALIGASHAFDRDQRRRLPQTSGLA